MVQTKAIQNTSVTMPTLAAKHAKKAEKKARIQLRDEVRSSKGANTEKLGSHLNKPLLPPPTTNGAMSIIWGKGTPLVALLGQVLSLQSLVSSSFWSTLWKNASFEMKQSVQLAPVIATAVEDSANEQARATHADAVAAGIEAGISGLTFTIGAVSAGLLPDPPGMGENERGSFTSEKIDGQGTNNLTDTNPSGSAENGSKGAKGFIGSVTSGSKKVGLWMQKAYTTVQMGQMLSAIGVNSVKANYDGIKADAQRAQGKFNALSEELKLFSQWYDKGFGRNEGLRNEAQRFIDEALQIDRTIADGLNRVIGAAFQG